MKNTLRALLLAAQLAVLSALNAQEAATDVATGAEELKKVDQVRVQAGDLIAVEGGETFTPTNSVVMPFGIKVMTNLTYTVNGGSERKLLEGQILNKDGTLQSADGSLMPVMDHITQKNGRVMAFKDGAFIAVDSELQLADGSRVYADGTYVKKSGERIRLLDGQLIKLDGSTLAATDTALLKGGKVVVQKDGSSITLRPTQSMMMSDGTKIMGDGTVINKDGSSSKLVEGEVLKLEGVRRR
jgi:hypothetical protein